MVSPIKRSKQKRASLESAFEGLNISSTPSTHVAAPKGHIGKSLAKMMKSTLRLAHGTLSRSVRGIETKFTIIQDEVYNYKIAHQDFDPDAVFPEMMELESEVQRLLQSTLDPKQQANLEDHILECLTKMVYGSNMIEKAGCGLDITWNLCMMIFRGENVSEDIQERDEEYQKIKAERMKAKLSTSSSAILRSRREIVQHAKAAAYIITQLCLHDQDLSEELILETHRILTYKVDAETAPWTEYSGVYRSVDVSAGFNTFTAPTALPIKMKEMIRQLDSDMSEAIKSGSIDPISLAAKYTHIFVNIHPFLDGNGRMCRLILNSMLLKFGSFIVCLGELGPERSLYLEVASSASQLETTYDGREEEEKPVMYKELASFVLSYAKTSLGKLVNAIAK
ncbi:uncharacterized protein N7483_001175 [Penicillium malachiteum]|uniref:uncharacterized protein n=1 Tax=Penicillium malachiteum TaxID=1324776 RepID=UPI002547D6B0|nr:uncharacterized protein N7483_001175 [Penicillium malachiteum]KAJ5736050.1 hypothetical protein N7483_001175 [Penicillium malachiteum]